VESTIFFAVVQQQGSRCYIEATGCACDVLMDCERVTRHVWPTLQLSQRLQRRAIRKFAFVAGWRNRVAFPLDTLEHFLPIDGYRLGCGDADAHLAAVQAQHRHDYLVTDHELFTDASCEAQWGRPVRMSWWDDRGGAGGKGITYLHALRPEMGGRGSWPARITANHRFEPRPVLRARGWRVGDGVTRLDASAKDSNRPGVVIQDLR
jgi:hypothetical protein